jgi:hypothetical protein
MVRGRHLVWSVLAPGTKPSWPAAVAAVVGTATTVTAADRGRRGCRRDCRHDGRDRRPRGPSQSVVTTAATATTAGRRAFRGRDWFPKPIHPCIKSQSNYEKQKPRSESQREACAGAGIAGVIAGGAVTAGQCSCNDLSLQDLRLRGIAAVIKPSQSTSLQGASSNDMSLRLQRLS